MNEPKGLMASDAQKLTKRGPQLQQFMQALGPSKTDVPLEQRLAAMSDTERATLLTTSKMVRMAMQMKIAARDYSMGYADLLTSMYGQMGASKRRIIVELLDETVPLSFTPQPKQPRQSSSQSFYDSDEMQVVTKEPTTAAADNADFLERLTQSESSGDSKAEITIADGRRYVGALQFGAARLQDYKKATGSSFSQNEFKADSALQDKVAAWHIADIDKAIDALGDAAKGYERDGLRSVAHLGGKSGMKKYVQSKGSYNPADQLGTSLQDYYDKFSA